MVRSDEPAALALRMRKHFAHKVQVETVGSIERVTITAGEFELEPRSGELHVRAAAPDEERLERVQEVVGSHLERFARGAPLDVAWEAADLHEFEARADGWIDGHRLAAHLRRTRDWVRALRPDASEALLVAALTHDVERDAAAAAPVSLQAATWDDEEARRAHAERSSELVADWLRGEGAEQSLVGEVCELVRLHERGGTPDADILQAADSLAFLETNPAARWVREGHATRQRADEKLRWMHGRIRVAAAREHADSLLAQALAEIGSQSGLPRGRG